MFEAYVPGVGRERAKSGRTLIDQERAALSGVAARGFSSLPGFAHEALLSVETNAKLAFDDANGKLIQLMLDRQLKRYGVEFDVEFKTAQAEWQLRKANLLADLHQELADIKRASGMKDAEVDSWLAEVRFRQTFLIQAQALLTESRERLKQEQIDIQASVEPERLVLISKKEAVIDARLAIIPYMLELLDAQAAVVAFNSTTGYQSLLDYISAKEELASARYNLIDPSIQKAAAVTAYANKLATVIPHTISKAQATVDYAHAEKAYIETYDTPLALAQLDFSKSQAPLLPYLSSIAATKITVANENLNVALAELDKAKASYQVAVAAYTLYDLMDQRATRLIDEVLPEQKELVSAMQKAVAYKKSAAAYRIDAATYKVSIAQASAAAFVLQTQVDVINTSVEASRLNYTVCEKEYRVNITDAQVAASVALYGVKEEYIDTKVLAQSTIASAEEGATEQANAALLAWKTRCPEILAGFQTSYYLAYSKDRGFEETQTAEIASKAKITSTLVHTIS